MSWTITPQTKVPVDPQYGSVSLLLHGNGTNGSTTITDNSPTPKTVTAVGNAQISTAQSKFGGSSIAFDGSGDYLSANANAAFGMGTDNFTVEAWIYPAVITGDDRGICDFRSTLFGSVDGGTFFIGNASTKLGFFDGNTLYGTTGTVVSTSAWSHVAVVRNGNTLTGFLNGQIDFSSSFNVNLGASRPLGIGGHNGATAKGSSPFNGYIDDLRITKGIARYTANFSVPTAQFPDI